MEGQNVSLEEEVDGLDPECVHFLARAEGQPVGTARLRIVAGHAKAERVAVLEDYRGGGVGRALMLALEAEAARRDLARVKLHAQVRVIPFYETLGYRAEGPVFEEAGIPHRHMEKQLEKPLEPAGSRG